MVLVRWRLHASLASKRWCYDTKAAVRAAPKGVTEDCGSAMPFLWKVALADELTTDLSAAKQITRMCANASDALGLQTLEKAKECLRLQ